MQTEGQLLYWALVSKVKNDAGWVLNKSEIVNPNTILDQTAMSMIVALVQMADPEIMSACDQIQGSSGLTYPLKQGGRLSSFLKRGKPGLLFTSLSLSKRFENQLHSHGLPR